MSKVAPFFWEHIPGGHLFRLKISLKKSFFLKWRFKNVFFFENRVHRLLKIWNENARKEDKGVDGVCQGVNCSKNWSKKIELFKLITFSSDDILPNFQVKSAILTELYRLIAYCDRISETTSRFHSRNKQIFLKSIQFIHKIRRTYSKTAQNDSVFSRWDAKRW